MIVSHSNKSIEGICVNEEFKAHNRKTCFDFIIYKEYTIRIMSNINNNNSN